MRFAFGALLFFFGLVHPASAQRQLAVTFDDLPYVGSSLAEADQATDVLLAALAVRDVPASVFVTGRSVEVEGEEAVRYGLLRRWYAAGHTLENHSYSHLHFNDTDTDHYLADVERGHAVVSRALEEVSGKPVSFFRAPFNEVGETEEARTALLRSLAERGVRLAPFTVEHVDWLFNAVYADALVREDTVFAERVGQAYVAHLDTAFTFAERLSEETFGREIPQIFLLHANAINAAYMPAMLDRLAERGYAFVSLHEAVEDPAYETPNAYTGKWGISWLHRWRVGLGLPNALRDEPEPPKWVRDAWQALSN